MLLFGRPMPCAVIIEQSPTTIEAAGRSKKRIVSCRLERQPELELDKAWRIPLCRHPSEVRAVDVRIRVIP